MIEIEERRPGVRVVLNLLYNDGCRREKGYLRINGTMMDREEKVVIIHLQNNDG